MPACPPAHHRHLLHACSNPLQVLVGDILSDLPEVDNFELHERRCYREGPGRLTQVCDCVCVAWAGVWYSWADGWVHR